MSLLPSSVWSVSDGRRVVVVLLRVCIYFLFFYEVNHHHHSSPPARRLYDAQFVMLSPFLVVLGSVGLGFPRILHRGFGRLVVRR